MLPIESELGECGLSFWLMIIGAGLVWHGVQIVWVAPTPSQFRSDAPQVEKGSPAAFQVFWLDQYAWIGISLAALGVILFGWGVISGGAS